MTTLLLWDIDGTLIASGGAGIKAMQIALKQVFGIAGSLDDIEFAGRTDRWIARQIFQKFSLPVTEENLTRYFDGYVAVLPTELNNPRARVLAGVRSLLAAVSNRGGIAQGLLTGNLRRSAQVKLNHHGLWDYFPFGAFADDSEQRNHLAPHALRRAHAHAGVEFAPHRIWIIGDTPHDIACGRAIGARTLAVATGSHTREQLDAHAPDAVFDDLADTEKFFSLIS